MSKTWKSERYKYSHKQITPAKKKVKSANKTL